MSKDPSPKTADPHPHSSPSELGEWLKEKGIDLAELALGVAALFSASTQTSIQPGPTTDPPAQVAPAPWDNRYMFDKEWSYQKTNKRNKGQPIPPHLEELRLKFLRLGEISTMSDAESRRTTFVQFERDWSEWIASLNPQQKQQVAFDIAPFRPSNQ
jgi:hypothetical protein